MFPDLALMICDLDNLPMYEPPSEEMALGIQREIAHSLVSGNEGEVECALTLHVGLQVLELVQLQNQYLRSQLYRMISIVHHERMLAALAKPLHTEKAGN